jgi:hypothetical protein
VLRARHGLHLVHVEELELAVHGLQTSQHDRATLGRPKQMVGGFVFERPDELNFVNRGILVDHRVERHIRPRAVAVDHREAVALGLPRERDDLLVLVGQLQHFHRAVGLLHAEQLEAAVDALLGLGVVVNLAREVVAALLPVHLHVRHREQVLGADLLLARQRDQRHARGLVAAALLGLKHGQDGVRGGPAKVDDALEGDGLFIHQGHRRRFVHGNLILLHAREERAVGGGAAPLEHRPRQTAARAAPHGELGDGTLERPELRAASRVEKAHENSRFASFVVRRPRSQKPLARRKLDELHAVVRELLEPREPRATPQRDTLSVHGG